MPHKVLFVDDEPAFLDAYRRLLLPLEADTAIGAESGFASIRNHGPYAVVVSDMRMPGMNGAQFLARVRQEAPETIRMILTAYADLNVAMDAVNHGQIFRFLAKPCSEDLLTQAITSGLIEYRVRTAEKDSLENILVESIKVLADVLRAVSPEAFRKSIRITLYVRHLMARFQIPSPWCFEAAAMLSQLGCIQLDPELIQCAYLGTHLSAEDRLRFESHPRAAGNLLGNATRLQSVAWIIAQQFSKETPSNPPQVPEISAPLLILGAKMLKVAVAFDNLKMKGISNQEAVTRLRYRAEFDHDLVGALAEMKPEEDSKMELRQIPISALAVGMILQQNIKTHAGVLVVAKGQEVTAPLLNRLEHFSVASLIQREIMALVRVYID